MTNGYKVIDLKGKDLALIGTKVKVDGIYERIEGNYGKPTLLTGIVIGGKEFQPQFVSFYVVGSDYKCNIPDGTPHVIVISQTDMVNVQA